MFRTVLCGVKCGCRSDASHLPKTNSNVVSRGNVGTMYCVLVDASMIDKHFLFDIFQALCGSRVEIPLLGGDQMMVNLQDEIVKPSTVKRIVGKGLPLPKDPGRRGDLIINFDIVFPERLSSTTREVFRSHLPGK